MSEKVKDINIYDQFQKIIEIPKEAESRKKLTFFYRIANFNREKKALTKIATHLDNAKLLSELKITQTFVGMIEYTLFGFSILYSLIKIKKITSKFLMTGSIILFQKMIVDSLLFKYAIESYALKKNDYLSQEVRLLYMFYLSHDPKCDEFKKKSEEYKTNLILKREAIKKYGEI